MKSRNILFFLIIMCLNSFFTTAQQYVRLTTPNNSVIEGILFSEMSDYEKQQIAAQIQREYPDAQILDAPSNLYNCHSYAWNMTEGGPTCWINYVKKQDGSANLYLYWQDGSYEQTTGSWFSKIHYYQGDHSAVSSSVAGMYESKWGQGPLMRHTPTDVPSDYQASYRRYYLRKITLLPGSTYQFKHPNRQSATWSATGLGSNMSMQSSGLFTNHNPKFTGTITVSGTNSGGTYTVAVPIQGEYIQGYYTIDGVRQNFKNYYPSYPVYPVGLNINKTFSITITPPENATVNWFIESGNLTFRQSGYSVDVDPVNAYGRLRVEVKTSKGTMQEVFCINVGAPNSLSFTLNDNALRIKQQMEKDEITPFIPEMTALNELAYPTPLSSNTYNYEIVGLTKANLVDQGEIILSQNREAELDISSLPAGYYILTITSNHVKINSYKFIKK